MRGVLAWILVVIASCAFVAMLVYIAWPTGWQSYERGSAVFDSDQWKQHRITGSTYRWCAVDDLLAKHQLIGMTRQQVIDLLGQPTGYMSGPSSIDYILAPQPLVDRWWLIIDLDKEGVVIRVYEASD